MGENSLLLLAKFVPLLILFLLFQLDSSGSKSPSLVQTLSQEEKAALSRFISKLRGQQVPPAAYLDCTDHLDPSPAIVINCSFIDSGWHITEIDASSVSLGGSISDDVAEFKYLRSLVLYDNKLERIIPPELGTLSHLTKLDLSFNQLNGSIPTSLGSLSNLIWLDLSGNNLEGAIPPELGTLSHLTGLDLSSNQLIWHIPPSLENLKNLTELNLGDNLLMGSIPQNLGTLKSLRNLILSYNQLTGSIPQGLGTLKNLIYLLLGNNELTGTIPSSFGNLSNLIVLNLRMNLLDGRIPQSLYNLSSLRYLDLSVNKLSGEISSELERLSQLNLLCLKKYMYRALDDNEFNGILPKEVGSLKNLQALWLASNYFSGELPTEYTNLTNLILFNVCGCNLTGAINPNISRWRNLTTLCLLGNNFRELPQEIFGMRSLETLMVSDIDRPPVYHFPNLTELHDLKTLVLRNCNIHAGIPEDIGKWFKRLNYMDLSFNNLLGRIPNSLGNLNLSALFLTRNMLEGKIPDKIQNIYKRQLDLSQNNFDKLKNKNIIEPKRSFPSDEQIKEYCGGKKSKYNSLYINCGGEGMNVDGNNYDADTSIKRFKISPKKNWGYTCSGDFNPGDFEPEDFENYGYPNTSNFIKNMTCEITLNNLLYKNARLCPQSLTYYGFCLHNGKYIVKLRFAEIVFAKNEDLSITGKRVFDIYIQGKQVEKDFHIKAEAGGPNKNLTKKYFNVEVNDSQLEIRLYWAGKGSVSDPVGQTYLQGPLISAISVTLDKHRGLTTTQIVAIVIAAVLAPFLLLVFMWRMGWMGDRELQMSYVNLRGKSYTVKEIKDATRNFSQNNVIGYGRFGIVYKAELTDQHIVAVKKLSFQSKLDQIGTEVYVLKQLKHENVVELLDVYSRRDLHLLIYEYMEKSSLKEAFCDDSAKLDWKTRVNICLGITRGLKYLHEDNTSGEIVHRNIKASNILLDGNFNAKISDLGLAKLYDEANPYKFIEEIGTAVYMAPEYAMRQPITVKADVYGYGIVLVEIVSGKSNSKSDENLENDYLLNKACVLHSQNRHLDLVDENLSGDYDKRQAVKILDLAMKCINLSPNLRPAMSEVVRELELISELDASSA